MSHISRDETTSQSYSGHHGRGSEETQESVDGGEHDSVTEQEAKWE